MRAERSVLYVPVRVCASDIVSIRTGCLSSGQQVGLAFTAPGNLAAALGLRHASIRIHIRALSEMLKPHGITQVFVDATCLSDREPEAYMASDATLSGIRIFEEPQSQAGMPYEEGDGDEPGTSSA